LAISKKFGCLPSEVLYIEGEYPSYCFNEACMFLLQALEDKKTLKFPREKREVKHFKSFSDYYKDMGVSV
jgi:hypothetical protein